MNREEELKNIISSQTEELKKLKWELGKTNLKKEAQDKKTKEAKDIYDFSSNAFKIFTFIAVCITLTTIFSFSVPFLIVSLLLIGIDVFTIVKYVKNSKIYKEEKLKSENLNKLVDSCYNSCSITEKSIKISKEELSRILSAKDFRAELKKKKEETKKPEQINDDTITN